MEFIEQNSSKVPTEKTLVRANNLLSVSLEISLAITNLPVPGRHCPQDVPTQTYHLWTTASTNSILFLICPLERLLFPFPFIRNMLSFKLILHVDLSQRHKGSRLKDRVKYLGIHFCCSHLCCRHLGWEFSAQNWGYRNHCMVTER